MLWARALLTSWLQGNLPINEGKTPPLLHAWLLRFPSPCNSSACALSLLPGGKSIIPSHSQVWWRGIHSPGSQKNSLPFSPEAQTKSPDVMCCMWSLLCCHLYLRSGWRCSCWGYLRALVQHCSLGHWHNNTWPWGTTYSVRWVTKLPNLRKTLETIRLQEKPVQRRCLQLFSDSSLKDSSCLKAPTAQNKATSAQLSEKHPEIVISHYFLDCILIIDRQAASVGWLWLPRAQRPSVEGIKFC